MKTLRVFAAAAVFVCFAFSAMANTVNVTGDLQNDGKLMININWTLDFSKYPGLSRDVIRKNVRKDIWNATLPKIVEATKGLDVSLDKSNFTLLKETSELVKTKSDGTKRYSLNMQVQFNGTATPIATEPAKTAKVQKYQTALQQRWDNEM